MKLPHALTAITLACTMACLTPTTLSAQKTALHPTPQQYETTGTAFATPTRCRLHIDPETANSPAVTLLRKHITQHENAPFTITIGKKGDKAVKKYRKLIPGRAEGYYLQISESGITLAANDERGMYYGAQTLAKLLENGMLQPTRITDYPDVPFRGIVEGFYGTPWSHEARLSQLEFYGRNKMNTYLYGPKNDPYHSTPNWRKPYPEKEARQIKELVDKARECNVNFYWAVHPGRDIQWTEQDRDNLVAKLESMYNLGVRAFAVFFDDISGQGTDAAKQAHLLNYLNRKFIKKKGNVAPLVMCPTAYNKGRSEGKPGYLATLGRELDKDIQIMWTGRRVLSDIDKEVTNYVNPIIGRKAYIWWNFPVTDYIYDHLLLGPTCGNGTDIQNDLGGFVANPMQHAEASKIALYGVADYTWNMQAYDSTATWKHAIHELMPKSGDHLETFCAHNSGLSDRDFAREESKEIRTQLHTLAKAAKNGTQPTAEDWNTVYEECERMATACNVLNASGNENPALIGEIQPWIDKTKCIAEYGKAVLRLARAEGNPKEFKKRHMEAQAALTLISESDAKAGWSPKSATRHLLPTLNTIFEETTARHNRKHGTKLNEKAEYTPYAIETNVEQLERLAVRRNGKRGEVAEVLETVIWPENATFALVLDYPRTLSEISIDLQDKETHNHFRLETSTDGTNWQPATLTPENKERNTRFKASLPNRETKKIRLTNITGKQLETYFKRFRVTQK